MGKVGKQQNAGMVALAHSVKQEVSKLLSIDGCYEKKDNIGQFVSRRLVWEMALKIISTKSENCFHHLLVFLLL